jgi:hypothetical protein
MRKAILIFLFTVLPVASADEESGATAVDTAVSRVVSDDSTARTTVGKTTFAPAASSDTLPGSPATADSTVQSVTTKTTVTQSQTEASKKSSIRKIHLTKREYNYKQQVILALSMMAFIAIIMTTAQLPAGGR